MCWHKRQSSLENKLKFISAVWTLSCTAVRAHFSLHPTIGDKKCFGDKVDRTFWRNSRFWNVGLNVTAESGDILGFCWWPIPFFI